MTTIILVLQGLMAFIFLFSGINKAYFDEKTLVQKGQTGVEGLNKWFIKFIGVSEVFGAIGLVLPMLLDKFVFLTPIAAICLGAIMIPAALIHYKRQERRNVVLNVLILVICVLIAYYHAIQ